MHSCPNCGQACYCSGDIDDVEVMTEAWVYTNCKCDCDGFDRGDLYEDDEEEDAYDPYDDFNRPI